MNVAQAEGVDRFVDKVEAARILDVRPRTLDKWCIAKQGPRCRYVGRLRRYSLRELAEFMNSRPSGGGSTEAV
jgi:hypothetical protein